VHDHRRDATYRAVRLVKYPELSKQGGTIVVRPFAGQAVFAVERENSAERKRDLTTGRGQTPPRTEMPPANDNLRDDRVGCCVSLSDVERQRGEGLQQPGVERADVLAPHMMRIEGLVVETRSRAEGAHDARKIVFVLMSDVPIDDREAGRHSVLCTHQINRPELSKQGRTFVAPATMHIGARKAGRKRW
jgi:hypothetical protein